MRLPNSLLVGMEALRRDNPWPRALDSSVAPFHFALDKNGDAGREIIIEAIRAARARLMIEVGCFLCGSSRHWLEASADLTVIGVDPWEGNWAPYLRHLVASPRLRPNVAHFERDDIERMCDALVRHGNFAVALNNILAFRDRFIPVRRAAPEALDYLAGYRLRPDIIYLDADKLREPLDVAHRLFPDALLCGDDWLWPDATGRLVMQEHVIRFAAEHGHEVRHARQSWVLVPPANRKGGRPT